MIMDSISLSHYFSLPFTSPATPSSMNAQMHTASPNIVESLEQNTLDDDQINNLDSDDDTHIPGGNAL